MAKNKVSNNLLSIMLGFAILTSVVGILASMNILSPLTGAATDTGTVTTNITDTASCTASDSTIVFGNLASGATNQSERVNTTLSDFHTVENNGNVNLTISAYASAELWDNYAAPTTNWQIHCNVSESGICNKTYGPLENSGGSYSTLIQGLEPLNSEDLGTFGVKITAQNDEPNGQKSGTVTYYCVGA